MMLHLEEEIRESGQYDVIVAGGGVAGVAAAIAAARRGRKVLLIEKSMKLGGLATLGLIHLFVPMCNGRGKQIIFGMAEEFLRLAIRYGYGDVPPVYVNGRIPEEKLAEYKAAGKLPPRYLTRFSSEIFALALTELCRDEGVELMFDSIVSSVVKDEKNPQRIKGVVIENKSGREYFGAQFFIDTTGDGDLMARAGVPTFERGNYHSYVGSQITMDTCRAALESGNIGKASSYFHGGDANLYGRDHPADMPLYYGSKREEVNRYLIANQLEMLEKLKETDRNERNIITLPGMAQFRTTRRIDGDYVLKESDAYRHFPDSVGAICDFDRRDFLFEIPYSAMICHGWDNIITAGRSAAADGYAWDVLRVIPPAIISGQAAGNACALAMESGKGICDVDLSTLQKRLADENVMIHFDDADVPAESADIHENNDQQ